MAFLKLRTPGYIAVVIALGLVGLAVWRTPLLGAEAPVTIAPPAIDNPKTAGSPQTAVLAGGCVWGVQGVFEHVRGVKKATSGYAGGEKSTAQYGMVGMGNTGHAESVQIVFDPAQAIPMTMQACRAAEPMTSNPAVQLWTPVAWVAWMKPKEEAGNEGRRRARPRGSSLRTWPAP